MFWFLFRRTFIDDKLMTFSKFSLLWSFLDEPTIITLDQSTLHQVPNHLRKLIVGGFANRSPTKLDLMNAFVVASGLETGFIGDWCCCEGIEAALSAYQLNWCYSFDRRLLMDFAIMKPQDQPETFKFKFILKPDREILVHCFESGDLLVLSAQLVGISVITSTKSLALPISRYVVRNKLDFTNLPAGFRNLQELSIKLKNHIFLSLRYNIFQESACEWPYPSLHGVPDIVLHKILKYLNKKDVASLSTACKSMNQTIVQFSTNK